MNNKKIIVDMYGADNGPETVAEGIILALDQTSGYDIEAVGDSEELENIFTKLGEKYVYDRKRISILHAPGMIRNTDNPMNVVREKGASMHEALKALKNDPDAEGLLSCGNTGALMVGSIFLLGLTEGLKIPVLASLLPTGPEGKMICIADCGANVDCRPEDLVRFAKLGRELVTKALGREDPAVALLSVGKEKGKGNIQTKAAYELLEKEDIHFTGNAEPDVIYTGEADVLLCDGFPGNIILKNTEATAHNIMKKIEDKMAEEADPHTKEVLSDLYEEIYLSHELNKRGGAIFLGTSKTVIKAHGSASAQTVCSCICQVIGKGAVPMMKK